MTNKHLSDDFIIQETLAELNRWDIKARGACMYFAQFMQERFGITERHSHRLLNEVYSYGLLYQISQIRFHEFNLTETGRWVCEQPNGWIGYKQNILKEARETQRQKEYKELLELEKTERELDKLKHERSIRDKDELIKNLNIELQREAIKAQKANNRATWRGAIIGAVISAIFTLVAPKIDPIINALTKIWQWLNQL